MKKTLFAALILLVLGGGAPSSFAQFKAGELWVGPVTSNSSKFKIFTKQTRTTAGWAIESPTDSDQLRLYCDGTDCFIETSSGVALKLGSGSTVGFPAGSVTAPGLFVIGDSNTGISSPALDQFSITTAGVQRFLADATGNIGIGVTAPSYRLHVRVTENANTFFTVENPDATGLSAAAVIRPQADVAMMNFVAHGSGRTITRWGVTIGGWNELISVAGNGLAIGSIGSVPLILGTAALERLRITPTGGLQINSGTEITKHLSATASLDFTALAANSCEVFTITVTGAADGDSVVLGVPNALADVDGATERTTFFGWVSATDTVSVRRCNVTGTATAEPAAATVRADVWKH